MNQQVQTLLQQMAHSLGTTIQYLWSVELRQAFVVGIENLVWVVVLAVALWFAIKTVKKCFHAIKVLDDYDNDEETYFDDEDPYAWTIVLVSIASVVVVVFMLVDLNSGINDLINPAHYALQDISSFVTSAGK